MLNKITIKIWQLKHNEVALNSAWQFFERFVGLGCSFIASIFVIRYFAPAEYGVFAYAASYVTLFSSLTSMGLQSIVVREVVKDSIPTETSSLTSMGLQSIVVREVVKDSIPTETILGSAFVIMICGAVAALILAVGGALLTHEKSTATWIILIMCLTNIVGSLAVINYYFQAKIKARYIAYVLLVQDVIDICIRIGMVHFKAKLLSFALLGLIESILAYTAIYLLFKSSSKLNNWRVEAKTIKFLLHQSMPLAISGIMINLYMRLDQVMIEHYCGMQAVAEYSISTKTIEIFYIIPMIILPNLMPILVQANSISKKKFQLNFRTTFLLLLVFSLFLTLIVFFSGKILITTLYGNKYSQSGKVIEILSFLLTPIFIGLLFNLWVQIKGLQKYCLYFTTCGLLICVTFNLILIPKYGIIGASIAIVFAQILPFIWYFIISDLRLIFADLRYNQ